MIKRKLILEVFVWEQNAMLCCHLFLVSLPVAYLLYWHIKVTDEVNAIIGDRRASSGIMTLIYSIVTCGIYALYWAYTMGDKVDRMKGNKAGNGGILYLILALFGLGIIDYLLIQDAINKKVERRI